MKDMKDIKEMHLGWKLYIMGAALLATVALVEVGLMAAMAVSAIFILIAAFIIATDS